MVEIANLLRPNPPGATLPQCWLIWLRITSTAWFTACHTVSCGNTLMESPRARKQVMPWTNFLGGSITRLTDSVRCRGMAISSDVTQYDV